MSDYVFHVRCGNAARIEFAKTAQNPTKKSRAFCSVCGRVPCGELGMGVRGIPAELRCDKVGLA